MDTFLDANHMV